MRKKVTIVWPDGVMERASNHTGSTSYTPLSKGSIIFSNADVTNDYADPANPNKKWIQLENGHYIAVEYPSASGPSVRATVEDMIPPAPNPAADPVVDVDVKVNGATVGSVTVNGIVYERI